MKFYSDEILLKYLFIFFVIICIHPLNTLILVLQYHYPTKLLALTKSIQTKRNTIYYLLDERPERPERAGTEVLDWCGLNYADEGLVLEISN